MSFKLQKGCLINSDYSKTLKVRKYSYNLTTLKKYGDNYLKIQTMNVQRTPFLENPNKYNEDNIEYDLNPFTNKVERFEIITEKEFKLLCTCETIKKNRDERQGIKKMHESIIRSKRLVFEYAFSNSWDYFCTFTIDKNKYDRYNLNKYHKDFAHFIRNYFRRKHNLNVQYLCIPEKHKDGAWHEHALISGVTLDLLQEFTLSDKLPTYIRKKLMKNEKIYTCPEYERKFGFCTFEPVKNSEACAKYITKYITKDLTNSVEKLNAKIFYVSRGLKKAEKIMIGHLESDFIEDFKNDYCKSAMFSYSENVEKILLNKFEK